MADIWTAGIKLQTGSTHVRMGHFAIKLHLSVLQKSSSVGNWHRNGFPRTHCILVKENLRLRRFLSKPNQVHPSHWKMVIFYSREEFTSYLKFPQKTPSCLTLPACFNPSSSSSLTHSPTHLHNHVHDTQHHPRRTLETAFPCSQQEMLLGRLQEQKWNDVAESFKKKKIYKKNRVMYL